VKIHQVIKVDHVHTDLEARELVQALEVVAGLISPDLGIAAEVVVHELLQREKLGSTSVGDGFAIPHCKIKDLKDIAVYLARFVEPVDFGASDEKGVSFFFVVLSPPDQPAAHLQVLSQIARILKRTELRSQLMAAPTVHDVISALQHAADAEGL
jgi:mannitol/fructose-specific phosphotransferase system IIA component (Ntr-type)